ncbi:MAG: Ldh family oxidoreductase [Ectothiorhodospiraceae bacterium AqS1]|nr:Ldh family oxidoreductase [Ectothiorhodospiraceae bacterium AqS1]
MKAAVNEGDIRTLAIDELHSLAVDALIASKIAADNARCVADALVAADADGIASHGVSRIPFYADQALSGKVDGYALPRCSSPRNAVVAVDADNGFAYPAIRIALDRALERIEENGCVFALIANSHHAGAMGHHVERIADRGAMALAFSNSPAGIAPWGGSVGTFGTNPVAFACPRRRPPSLVIDLSLAQVARGKVMLAAKRKESIPSDWALDARGRPTTDPVIALEEGTMAPIGGAKGAALAMIVELITAALASSNLGFEAGSFFTPDGAQAGIAQSFVLVDPMIAPSGDFIDRAESLIQAMLAQPGVRLPGDSRYIAREKSRKNGIPIPTALYADLSARAAKAK